MPRSYLDTFSKIFHLRTSDPKHSLQNTNLSMSQQGPMAQPDSATLWNQGRAVLQSQSRFVSLPAELLLSVLENLGDDRSSLTSLARTCRALQPLAEAYIYSHIRLRDPGQIQTLMVAFDGRPARLENIAKLDILYDYATIQHTRRSRATFNAVLDRMTRIKELWVESPFDNHSRSRQGAHWYEYDMVEIRRALENASLLNPRIPSSTVGMEKLEKCGLTQALSFWLFCSIVANSCSRSSYTWP